MGKELRADDIGEKEPAISDPHRDAGGELLPRVIEDFDGYLTSHGYSGQIKKRYLRIAVRWAAWWKKPLSEFHSGDFFIWETYLEKQGYRPTADTAYRAAVRRFLNFLGIPDYSDKKPWEPKTSIEKLAQEYLGALLVQGYSPLNTATNRRYILRFIAHVESEGRDVLCNDRNSPKSVEHDCLLRWMQAIRLTGVSEFSLQANKSILGSFYKWLIRIGKVERNPLEVLAPIKLPDVHPRAIQASDTAKLLQGIREMPAQFRERNVAILEVFYASGIRQAEIRKLDLSDLAIEGPSPYVAIRQGKGKKDGIGRLTPSAVEAIKAWLPCRAELMKRWGKDPEKGPVFVSKSGKPLEQSSLWQMVSEAGKQFIGKHIHPHQLRHSFCTDLLNNGADLESIRKLARHKHLVTTQKYLNVSTEHLDDAYAKHPRSGPAEMEGPKA